MRTRKLTVYTTISRDGIIRWALHPMSSAPPSGLFDRRCRRWPFRVLWFGEWDDDCLVASCRGADWYVSPVDMTTDVAMRWLVEGEEEER